METGKATAMELEMSDVYIAEVEPEGKVLEELLALSGDWEAENSCHGYRRNEAGSIEGNRCFVANKGHTIIGYLFGHSTTTKEHTSVMVEGTDFFEVEELYIKPAYRSKGIGKALFQFVEAALAGEVDYLMLSTATKNWKAILHFYLEELGMEFWHARLFKKLS